MNEEIPLRKQLGFSQEIYAQYLRVSKSMVSLVELGKRTLSGVASKRDYDLYFHWKDFEKNWIPVPPPPPLKTDIEEARKFLEDEIFRLKHERDKKEIASWPSDAYVPDYPKVNAFLQQELDRTTERIEEVNLRVVLAINDLKMMGKPMVETLKQNLADRFLDFQISELERCLAELPDNLPD